MCRVRGLATADRARARASGAGPRARQGSLGWLERGGVGLKLKRYPPLRAWFPASVMHADGANARALAVTLGVLMRFAERPRENETGRVRAALRARECGGARQAPGRNRRGRGSSLFSRDVNIASFLTVCSCERLTAENWPGKPSGEGGPIVCRTLNCRENRMRNNDRGPIGRRVEHLAPRTRPRWGTLSVGRAGAVCPSPRARSCPARP